MTTVEQAAADFLASRRIAVTGVSRNGTSHGANVVYQRLRDRGYDVVPVNPNTGEVEGDRCYPDLRAIPDGVDAVVIGTRPEHAEQTVRECVELGVGRVWMHQPIAGGGSVSARAAEYGRSRGLTIIDGGCPLMFPPVSDPGHRIMRRIGTVTRKVPRRV